MVNTEPPVHHDSHQGRRVIVTGAGSGIGRAAFEAFRTAGARTIGLDVKPSPAPALDWVVADLTDEAAIVAGVAQAVAAFGGLDVLVNCAGIEIDAPIREIDVADVDRMIAVNLRAPMLVTREALKGMGKGGRIVNVASELAYLGRPNASGYCATKAGILSLTRSWARELAPDILVNAVAPGPVDTPLLGFGAMSEAQKAIETANPMGRIGRPEEVARAILFLAAPETSFTTGQCLSVDGGAAMH
ncbi:SDR family NAD(P)-dependent oxidoreductase [Aurantimonas sp. VKM B-3413]|uniref:SDR family NAD(P)-dependent oxidoreductase n=1 Tax=Aurantimonas sp. VKM B-3413 TaxID=2779401 RepID=UPI001E386CEF|nr:SDR family oxidoreductase [Aurantimonas sp. VKM B-3413]MCB8838304.1 SDR family oxidoreductase [Aurantimonas sp. VKM B-3413]